jgi:hypothetical protein
VGNFTGSQRVASLSGKDAGNYSFQNVLGDYQVKTGFSSGAIYPREMTSSPVKVIEFKDTSASTLTPNSVVSVNAPSSVAQDNKAQNPQTTGSSPLSAQTASLLASPLQTGAPNGEVVKVSETQLKNELSPNALAVSNSRGVQKLNALVNPTKISKSLQMGLAPSSAQTSLASSLVSTPSSNASSVASPSAAKGTSSAPLSSANPTDQNTALASDLSKLGEIKSPESSDAQVAPQQLDDESTAPIYAAIREVLESEVTYQVVGGVTSVVVLTNALLTAASKFGLVNLAGNLPLNIPSPLPSPSPSPAPGNLPSRLPVNGPTPANSSFNNRFNPSWSGKI